MMVAKIDLGGDEEGAGRPVVPKSVGVSRSPPNGRSYLGGLKLGLRKDAGPMPCLALLVMCYELMSL